MVEFDVFISHSSHDKTTADATCAALEAAGIRCWIAPRDVMPGTPWATAIVKALDSCRVVVLIFSQNANDSEQIRREVDRAMNRGIPVVPLRIEDIVPTEELEYFMGRVHWLDAFTPPFEHHLKDLAKAVRALLDARGGTAALHKPSGASGAAEHAGSAQAPGAPAATVAPDMSKPAEASPAQTIPLLNAEPGQSPPDAHKPLADGRFGKARFGKAVGLTALGFVVLAGAAVAVWFVTGKPLPESKQAPSGPKFDASLVPLITAPGRAGLAEYPKQLDAKALAISVEGQGLSVGAKDLKTAETEALDQCRGRSRTSICRTYALGMDVVWQKDWIPLADPTDLRTKPLDFPLTPADWQAMLGIAPDRRYVNAQDHRALAISTGDHYWFVGNRESVAEAVRQALERCGYNGHHACLIASIDGAPTVQIPKSRRIIELFLPATEPNVSEAARARIRQVYEGPEWRAVAKGKSGAWYPVAGQASEVAAVEAALTACAQGDAECSLYAIGNFRVADVK